MSSWSWYSNCLNQEPSQTYNSHLLPFRMPLQGRWQWSWWDLVLFPITGLKCSQDKDASLEASVRVYQQNPHTLLYRPVLMSQQTQRNTWFPQMQLLPAVRSQGKFFKWPWDFASASSECFECSAKGRSQLSWNQPQPCWPRCTPTSTAVLSWRSCRHHQQRWEAVVPQSLVCIIWEQIVPICCVAFTRQTSVHWT